MVYFWDNGKMGLFIKVWVGCRKLLRKWWSIWGLGRGLVVSIVRLEGWGMELF